MITDYERKQIERCLRLMQSFVDARKTYGVNSDDPRIHTVIHTLTMLLEQKEEANA